MDNRKRARLEVGPITSSACNSAATTTTTTSGGQSIYQLSPSTETSLPANVFLTICDDDASNESQEYLTIDSTTLAAHIKQEPLADTSHQIQYRIINQRSSNNSDATQTAALLPSTVQLPSGCEIFLVKEYVNSASNNHVEMLNNFSTTNNPATISKATTTSFKVESDARLPQSAGSVQIVRNNGSCSATNVATAGSVVESGATPPNGGKRSYILEAYKKRDDKRRATHNEVERRRRDKINSWIFKLKEMLPAEMPCFPSTTTPNASSPSSNCASSITATTTNIVGTNNNCRTPPSDSKSQILIKACEYIKAMQEEMKSLRECLTENEQLRVSNQRLQNELNKLRSDRSSSQHIYKSNNNNNNNHIISSSSSNSPTNSFNVKLNSINGSGLFSGILPPTAIATTSTPATLGGATAICHVSSAIPYTKRELIIRDYVD